MSQHVECTAACLQRSGRDAASDNDSQQRGGAPISGLIPFRSPLREQVQETICEHCWKAWLAVQIKVINEFALNLGDPRSHDIIEAHARDFLGLSETPATTTDFASLGASPPASDEAN